MRIFVGGLPYSATGDSLRSLFEQAGAVSDAHVVQDRFTNESKGFAFVEMPNDAEARDAISRFNGYSLGGRNLTVNEARPREERSGGGGGGGRSGGGGGGGYGGGGGGGRGGRY
ncbi:RNA-binding protein [Armatimonas sp.]|uniref:RNA recognition motif domain-containing protein n=1 Tax=Armatimonas sp. TaxID=1872638 RepID=UPI00286C08D8|nr:RNA-binding protein [Armatimonas sp.]